MIIEHKDMDDFFIPVQWEIIKYLGNNKLQRLSSEENPQFANVRFEEALKKYPDDEIALYMMVKIRYEDGTKEEDYE